jgi:hypothetical protein
MEGKAYPNMTIFADAITSMEAYEHDQETRILKICTTNGSLTLFLQKDHTIPNIPNKVKFTYEREED